jgi:hypothetical protein
MIQTSIKISLTTFKDLYNSFPYQFESIIGTINFEIEKKNCSLIIYEEFDINTFQRETPIAQFIKAEDFNKWIEKNYPFN